jgi:hypothetical protein
MAGQGYAAHMAPSRDPISLEYDQAAVTILAAIALRRTWPPEGVPVVAFVDMPLLDLPDEVPGSAMTRHQRAFVRSLYWNLKQSGLPRSIRLPVWGPRNLAGRQQVTFRVFTLRDGQDFIEAVPQVSYIEAAAR